SIPPSTTRWVPILFSAPQGAGHVYIEFRRWKTSLPPSADSTSYVARHFGQTTPCSGVKLPTRLRICVLQSSHSNSKNRPKLTLKIGEFKICSHSLATSVAFPVIAAAVGAPPDSS